QKDAWPSKTIKIITPTPAGVGSDAFSRMYADKLSKALKVPVIVENKPGALSTLGVDAVAKSPADGYTLLVSTGNPFTMAPFLLSKLPYNPEKDFIPVTQVFRGGSFLVVNKDVPAKSLRELVILAKSQPGKITFASYGPGTTSHLGFELFQDYAGVEMLHIPYKQGAMVDVIGGQVMVGWEPPVSALPHIKSGKVRALAYTGTKRSTVLPDVPTLNEVYPGFEVFTWVGFWVPAGTPAAIVQKLYTTLTAITKTPEMQRYIDDAGNEPISPSPTETAAIIKREAQFMGKLIKAKNIRLD
ncbi:MAG: Tripartite-type tricarboxylate transporter, receptor component TctC, partial [Ramlibacter sp.]|nr:Tripartite-type tricarboxylate transporter, receptor component TctC [Ramlibacter sp.]